MNNTMASRQGFRPLEDRSKKRMASTTTYAKSRVLSRPSSDTPSSATDGEQPSTTVTATRKLSSIAPSRSRLAGLSKPRFQLPSRDSKAQAKLVTTASTDAYSAYSDEDMDGSNTTAPKRPRKIFASATKKAQPETASKPADSHREPLPKSPSLPTTTRKLSTLSASTSISAKDDASPTKPVQRVKPAQLPKPKPTATKLASKKPATKSPERPPSYYMTPSKPPETSSPPPLESPLTARRPRSSKAVNSTSEPPEKEKLDKPRPAKRPFSRPAKAGNPHGRKRRLIDQLAAQAESEHEIDSSNEESDEERDEVRDVMPSPAKRTEFPDMFSPESQRNLRREPITRRTPQNKVPGLKFTYGSQQRSFLSEPSDLAVSGTGDPLDIFVAAAKASQTTYDIEEEDEELEPTGIRSLHELRQAGATSRFSDGMEDLLDRIGTPGPSPSSMRRGGLIELVAKLKERSFSRQLRDFGGDVRLFSNVGPENDLIAGVTRAAGFLVLVACSKATHITTSMESESLLNLLLAAFDETSDLQSLAKARTSNLSKHAQTNFTGLASTIQSLAVWEGQKPVLVSPRLVALKSLDLVIDDLNDKALDDLMVSPIVNRLFDTVSLALESEGDVLRDYELVLALTVLKIFSVKAMESSERERWTREYLPVVMGALERALENDTSTSNSKVASLAIQLTLNMTNNNPEAVQTFSRKELLGPLVAKIRDGLKLMARSVGGESFSEQTIEDVVLLLGVMINFCEHSPSIRAVAAEFEALDGLISPLLVNYKVRTEADSVDKTQVNVVYGYLSVLLGYICLDGSARSRFKDKSQGSLEPLFGSLREFVAHHLAVEKAVSGESDFEPRMNTLMAQLQQEERQERRRRVG